MRDRRVSIVIPVFNERTNIGVLLRELRVVLEEVGVAYEFVVVDDRSDDGTFEVLRDLHNSFETLRVMRLSRNFGHQPALLAGMRAATGEAVITMDGDLQHPPEVIPALIEAWRKGARVVHTIRDDSAGKVSVLKRLPSQWFYRVMRWNSDVPIRAGMADFRLVDRVALDQVLNLDDSAMFFRGLFLWIGFEQNLSYATRRGRGYEDDPGTRFAR